MPQKREKLLLLTLVHPDFLPPVYASAQSLRDAGYDITIITFDSFVPAPIAVGDHITIETMGPHHKVGLKERMALRSKYRKHAQQKLKEGYKAIVAYCPFSFLTALKIGGSLPVIYYAMELADFTLADLKRSPLTAMSYYTALRSLKKAYMLATPSVQRSAWLAGRSHLESIPETIFNTAYVSATQQVSDSRQILKNILPDSAFDKKIVLYTGAVNDRLCVKELVMAFDQLNDNNTILAVTGFKDNAYCNEIKQYVAASPNKDKMYLLPYVTREEMLALQETADIGVCLMKDAPPIIESQMIAPNKTGEYLNKGLYILGVRNIYMNMFEAARVGSLAETVQVADVVAALQHALKEIDSSDYKERIHAYVHNTFCMQKQIRPMIKALESIK